MKNTIDTLVFDLGGVLIDWNPRYLYREIFPNSEEMEHFLNQVCTSEWNEQQDAGRSLAEGTETLVVAHPNWEPEIRAFYGQWEKMLQGPITGTLRLLEKLAGMGNYRLYALTNWSAELWPIAWERYAFLKTFQGILVSGQEKMAKPEARIYALLFQRFGIRPEKALFIDDNLRNVIASRQAGMAAYHFNSPEGLEGFLTESGLL